MQNYLSESKKTYSEVDSSVWSAPELAAVDIAETEGGSGDSSETNGGILTGS